MIRGAPAASPRVFMRVLLTEKLKNPVSHREIRRA